MPITKPLTEQEKWECTARWLNATYRACVFQDPLVRVFPEEIGPLSIEEALYNPDNIDPCCVCPIYFEKCQHNTMDHNVPGVCKVLRPPQESFQVLEKYTGANTIVSYGKPGKR